MRMNKMGKGRAAGKSLVTADRHVRPTLWRGLSSLRVQGTFLSPVPVHRDSLLITSGGAQPKNILDMVLPSDKGYAYRFRTPVMKYIRSSRLAKCLLFAAVLLLADHSRATDPHYWSWAQTPPMGWNSWDSFGAGVWQADALANADYMAKNLKAHGWNIITIDIQWYEPLAHTTQYR
jgi:hypothetical protein